MGLFGRCLERHQRRELVERNQREFDEPVYKYRFNKICFIEPPYGRFMARLDAPFALMYLASIAEQAGWKAEIVEMYDLKDPLPQADVYAVTSSSPQFPATIKLATRLGDEFPDALRMVGGNHISAVPEDLFKTCFNIGVFGEGERALTKILSFDSYQLAKASTCVGVEGERVESLDSVPFPARHLIDWSKYKRGIYWGRELLAPAVSMISSRGCPYSCVYCGSHVVFGRRTRFRSVENVCEEAKHVINTLGYHGLNFHDDEFTLNRDRTIKLCRELVKLEVVWRCLTRADLVDEKLLEEMEMGGCKEIILGVESGSQKVLDSMNKRISVKQNLKAMKMIKKAGIQLKTGIMVGCPSETKKTVEETKRLLRKCPPDFWNVSVFTPFPGCAVWENPERYGIKILTRDLTQYSMVGKNHRGIVVSETEAMNKKDIEQARDELIELLLEVSPP